MHLLLCCAVLTPPTRVLRVTRLYALKWLIEAPKYNVRPDNQVINEDLIVISTESGLMTLVLLYSLRLTGRFFSNGILTKNVQFLNLSIGRIR